MKKIILLLAVSIMMNGLFASSTNLENIYGKNDMGINNNYAHIYGNNFGSLIERNTVRPYTIDIEVANEEIELLYAKNTSFENENTKYKTDIEVITNKIENLYDHITRIDTLMNSVISSSIELYTLSKKLRDSEMRLKLQVSIEENRQQKYDLENKQLEVNRLLYSLRELVDVKKRYITVNNLYIRRNIEQIDFLKGCIELTGKDSGALDHAVIKSSSHQLEVDALLQAIF